MRPTNAMRTDGRLWHGRKRALGVLMKLNEHDGMYPRK